MMTGKLTLLALCSLALPIWAHAYCTTHTFQINNNSSIVLEVTSQRTASVLNPGESVEWEDFAHYEEHNPRTSDATYKNHYTEITWAGSWYIGCGAQFEEREREPLTMTCNYYPAEESNAAQNTPYEAASSKAYESADRLDMPKTGLCGGCQVDDSIFNNFSTCNQSLDITDQHLATNKE